MAALILVIDDDEPVRVMLARLLAGQGYQVIEFENGLAAREWLDANRPDLVITDIVMPGLSGTELRRYIARKYPRLPVILISGYSADEPAEFAARSPHTVFVPKPFAADELLELIEEMLPEDKIPPRRHPAP
ncbi:Nitrogen regulation protein NR(I) [bacterium HR29]|nr:Nitrogen regulation protein NR(I) [bacterium HR29]